MSGLVSRTVSTDTAGRYVALLLDPGSYDLTVRKEGFRSINRAGVKLDVAQVTAITFVLEVGAVNESVRVTSQTPLLDSGSATLGHTMENNSIVNLPLNGRNSYSFATLVPGVRASRGFGQAAFGMFFDHFVS